VLTPASTCKEDTAHENAQSHDDGHPGGSVIERFNNTLRQRLSRLVHGTLTFSKKVDNHIGATRYFIGHYNLTRAALLI